MSRTNTHEEHRKFQAEVEGRSRRSRRWAVGGAAAATVAAVAGFALWSADTGDRADSGPAGGSQSAVEVADSFVAAFAARDADRVASLLDPAAGKPGLLDLPGFDDWRETLRADEAWSREYLFEPCVETGTAQAGTTVGCPFDMNVPPVRKQRRRLRPAAAGRGRLAATAASLPPTRLCSATRREPVMLERQIRASS